MFFLSILVFCLLSTAAISSDLSQEDKDMILIDQEEFPVLTRVERQVEEGSGMWDDVTGHDYGVDDEDHVNEFGSTNIVSSRVVPVASSPIFSYPVSPSTGFFTPTTSRSLPHSSTPEGPARPPRLSSYYPDITGEGSGGGNFISTVRDFNESDLIAPTKTQYSAPTSSLTPAIPPDQTPATNHEPFINSRLDKVPLTAGKSSRIIIPANTFQDLEDGDTRDLRLRIVDRDTGVPINDLGWAHFKTENQEIISLPLEDNIGVYNFRVVATDSGGESQHDTLVIAVRQLAISRTFHHEFQANFAMISKSQWQHSIDWKFELLENIVSYFGDSDPGKITVLEMAETTPGHIRFRWTNDSLPRQSCPKEEVTRLFHKMSRDERPSPEFKTAVRNHFRVKDINLKFKGLCSVRKGQDTSVTIPRMSGGNFHHTGYDNSMPQIRNPVDKLNVTAGELLQYQVPHDMCWDKENGGTRDLNLQLLTLTRLEVDSDNWLQFDTKNQEFVGVPLENDVGREEYQLVCSDSEGYSAIDGIEVSTLSRPFFEKFNVLFVFVFNDTLDDGPRLARSRVKLMKKIAKIFRDPDTSHIVLSKVDPVSYEVAWYNKSLSSRDCPVEEIMETKNFLLHKDVTVRHRVVQAFEPQFHLADIKMLMLGSCLEVASPPNPATTVDPIHDLLPPQEYILAFVVPALIIVGMLLLAIIIACILHRKRKAGKLDMFKTEALPPRIPVIMQDELCEDNFNMSKQPIILREEPEGFNSYGKPPQYYGSGRMDEEYSECESLVNGNNGMNGNGMHGMGMPMHSGTLPSHHTPYARPPPVALEFSDSLSRSRHRPAPQYRKQHFNP